MWNQRSGLIIQTMQGNNTTMQMRVDEVVHDTVAITL